MNASTNQTNSPIPATRNEAWGFYGTMNRQAAAAWPLAITAISEATCQPPEAVRAFLDSSFGRHFADTVQARLYHGETLQDAISRATGEWMNYRVGAHTRRAYGIPRDVAYLTGFVILCEIISDDE
ncbi:hypothetical protein P3T23_009702 [Paraburkholderia sp. GAS448]|jgi:hypothetical protein|uniref:hypothetical protein n=1 Tax=Paraburkholderia sp. GAS448 TaxID=3035136 RepID=UPI003D255D5F